MKDRPQWPLARLDDICEINPRYAGPENPSTTVSFIPMPAVSDIEGVILPHGARPFSEVAKGYTRFCDGDVIFAKITPCMENGKIALARDLTNGFACGSTEFHVLRAKKEILPAYLWRFLRQDSFREEAQHHMTGAVGQRRVPLQFLKDSKIPLPPIPDQRQVISMLDSVLSRSKKAREETSRVPRLIERYRKAILEAAFQGRLTADNASQWSIVNLGDFIVGIDSGKNLRCEERPPSPSERGIVKVSSVSWGAFDPLASKTTSADLDPQTLIKSGDFLISRANTLELVGACVIVGDLANDNLHLSDKVLRVRFKESIESWVLHFLRSPQGRSRIESLAIGNQLSMRNISQVSIKSIRMPLPPKNVRARVLKSLEEALDGVTRASVETTHAQDLLARLEQTTLAKAFHGELALAD